MPLTKMFAMVRTFSNTVLKCCHFMFIIYKGNTLKEINKHCIFCCNCQPVRYLPQQPIIASQCLKSMPNSILLETWLLSNPKLSCWLIHCSSPMMISTLKSSYPLPLLTPWHRKPLFSLPLLRNNLSREYSPNQSFLPLHSFNFYQGYFSLFFHCLSAYYAAD